jgi:hypothetical protein
VDPGREDAANSEPRAESSRRPSQQQLAEQLPHEHEHEALVQQVRTLRLALDGSRRMLALLAHPGLRPALGADYGAYFGSVAQAIVGTVADGCTIELVTPEGLRPLAVAHSEPARERDSRDFGRAHETLRPDAAVLRLPLSARELQLGLLTVWSDRRRRASEDGSAFARASRPAA